MCKDVSDKIVTVEILIKESCGDLSHVSAFVEADAEENWMTELPIHAVKVVGIRNANNAG